MSVTVSLAVAFLFIALVVPSVTGGQPVHDTTRLRGERSPDLTARVVSVRPIVESRSSATGPAVTGGSGLLRLGAWTLIAQDDSTDLASIAVDGRIARLRLFDSVDGRNRFHPAFGNKNEKPDIEAIVQVRVSASTMRRLGVNPGRARVSPVILLFGSGSIRGVRDRVAIVVPRQPLSSSVVRVVTATGLYDRLRASAELSGSIGKMNLEAAAAVDGAAAIRLYNRGNSGPGSVTASVDISTRELLDYLIAASADPAAAFSARLNNPCQYDLGMSEKYAISIGEAVSLPPRRELEGPGAMLIAAIAEATTDAVEDGQTSGTALGLQLPRSRKLLFTPVMQDGKPAALKIEGLAIESIRAVGRGKERRIVMRVTGVVDSDSADPQVPSDLVELEVTYVHR